MTSLTDEQQNELKALWESRDYRAWFAKLQEMAPDEAERLPSYIRDAFLKLSDDHDNRFAIYVPPECAPERLAHYEVAPADELVLNLPYRDPLSGETRYEQATAAMLRQLVEQAERDDKIVHLIMKYWGALHKGEELKKDAGSDNLWLELLEAFDPILKNLFSSHSGRRRLGSKLMNISIHMISNNFISNRKAR